MVRFQFACGVLAAISWVCVASRGAYPDCDTAQVYHLGNGRCNEGFNNEACGYDGGDCCECTCLDSDLFECGTEGFNCLDPDAPCRNDLMLEEALDVRNLAEEMSFEPTGTPTSSPSTGTPTSSPPTSGDLAENMSGDSDDGGLSSQDAGIIVGCVIGALVVIGAVIFIRKRRALARDATDAYHPPGTTRFP